MSSGERFLVANLVNDQAPPAPPGYYRVEGGCADCGRRVNWMMTFARALDARPVVCGYCALARSTARAS